MFKKEKRKLIFLKALKFYKTGIGNPNTEV